MWIDAKYIGEKILMKVAVDRGSISQCAELFVSGDLQENLHRILYLDFDTLVNCSIREVWKFNMLGNTIAAQHIVKYKSSSVILVSC